MRESDFSLHKEITERQEMYSELDHLSGYNRLSENQQRFIKDSLYIQQRAERGTGEQSAANIQSVPFHWKKNAPNGTLIRHESVLINGEEKSGEPNNYAKSQLKVILDYCHNAASQLEKYSGETVTNKEWFDADPIKSYEDLIEAVNLIRENFDFPHFVEIYNLTESEPRLAHTTILLGEDRDNNVIAWEKSGYGLPYQLISLADLYNAYMYCRSWKFRPLSIGSETALKCQ